MFEKDWYRHIFRREKVESPILNYYFKSVTVDWVLHGAIKESRIKAGLQKW